MQSFAEALSNTNILHTLKYLHVRDSWFPKENVEQIFSRLGFDIKVDGSHSFPDEMQDEQQE